jgi:integrase
MAKASSKLLTLQAHVDSAPVIDGVNYGLKDDGHPKPVKLPVADYPGLFLQCLPTKPVNGHFDFTRSWCFRGTVKEGGKLKEIFRGLGSAESVSLAGARKAAEKLFAEMANGATVQGKRAERAALEAEEAIAPKAKEVTPKSFAWCAEAFIEQAKTRWVVRDGSTECRWRSVTERYINPVIGNLLVGDVTRRHVLQTIDPLWSEKRPTAVRVRQMIEEVVNWAIARGHCPERDNPANWDKLSKGLADTSPHTVKHHTVLHVTRADGTNDYTPVLELVTKLRADKTVTNLCLEFILLTGVRMSEARFARWTEFDLDAKVWTVPADRMKGKKGKRKAHQVPLSDRVVEILRIVKEMGGRKHPHVVFPSQGAGIQKKEYMGESNLVRNLKRHLRPADAGDDFDSKVLPDVHGFRSSLRDWGEDNDFDAATCEMALAHTVGGKVENSYRHTKKMEKRRKLMDAWAAFCEPTKTDNNVVLFKAVA